MARHIRPPTDGRDHGRATHLHRVREGPPDAEQPTTARAHQRRRGGGPAKGSAVSYLQAPNQFVAAANGVEFAYRETGRGDGPLVLLQHFRGNLDNWDPALVDALASDRRVIAFDKAGVGGSSGATPHTVAEMALDAIAFVEAMGLEHVDVLGFSLGRFVAQEMALTRPISSGGSCSRPRRPKARPVCTAGRLRSSTPSAHGGPIRNVYSTSSTRHRPPVGAPGSRPSAACSRAPRPATKPPPGRHGRHSTTRCARGGSPTTRRSKG